jgi:exopolyphosphatase/guanosine-5'-triphosphate,3'-diphosphate pyrophosphatase
MGTVRLLEMLNGNHTAGHVFGDLVRRYADSARERIERDLGNEKVQICVGTGGNVEEIGRLRQKIFKAESTRCVTLEELEKLIARLERMTYKERMRKWKLRPDRADVILPAAIVLHLIASEAGVKDISIPNVGLKDGILWDIAESLSKNPQGRRGELIPQE